MMFPGTDIVKVVRVDVCRVLLDEGRLGVVDDLFHRFNVNQVDWGTLQISILVALPNQQMNRSTGIQWR